MKIATATMAALAGLGSQNFLGYRWIGPFLNGLPERLRRRAALECLALSPHYFFRDQSNAHLSHRAFLNSEFERNARTRQVIFRDLISKYLPADPVVVDYGCGPGFLARSAADSCKAVIACDISPGVLACARILNSGSKIQYADVGNGRVPLPDGSVDAVYCFAVVQHITDDVFRAVLAEWWRILRPNGTVICHAVIDAEGWQTEADWRADESLRGRMKWRFGLHCFSRTPEHFSAILDLAGFGRPQITKIGDLGASIGDETDDQHLCVFTKLAAPAA